MAAGEVEAARAGAASPRVVVDDRPCAGRCRDAGVDRVAEAHGEALAGFGVGVAPDVDAERLGELARREGQRPRRGGVVRGLRGGAVGGLEADR